MEVEEGPRVDRRPPARKKIPKALRVAVWNRYVGEERGTTKCLCGTMISQLNFECGHKIAHSDGGSATLDNLVPVCASCNKSMGTTEYYTFLRELGIRIEPADGPYGFYLVPALFSDEDEKKFAVMPRPTTDRVQSVILRSAEMIGTVRSGVGIVLAGMSTVSTVISNMATGVLTFYGTAARLATMSARLLKS